MFIPVLPLINSAGSAPCGIIDKPVNILSKDISWYASEFIIMKSSAGLDKGIAQTALAYKKSIAKSLSEQSH